MASLQVHCRLLSTRTFIILRARATGSGVCLSYSRILHAAAHPSALASTDFLDPSEDQDHSSPHLRPATTTGENYLNNNGLSHPYPALLQSPPPPPSVSFSTAAGALTHGHRLTLSSFHLPRPSLPHLALAAGISPLGSRPAGVTLHPTAFSLSSSPSAPLYYLSAAYFHSSAVRGIPDKQKATIEKAVDIVKEKKKKVVDTLTKGESPPLDYPLPELIRSIVTSPETTTAVAKPSLARRAWDAVVHSYNGFRLLALDIRVAVRLLRKTLRGDSLTRRERKQFTKTVGDIFRVVPFSVFIIIPFMEILLPVYLWLFPSALPSTFQSQDSRDAKKKKELKVKLQMAAFLQDTIEEMAVTSKNPKKVESVQEFADFIKRIRTSGAQATTEEILKFSKLFEDELTLDNLTKKQLELLCKMLLLQPYGSSNFLRFQLRMKLRQLKADDQLIHWEGVDSMSVAELQSASQARGMRALGLSEERLKSQLQQWIDLHLNKSIPASLLLLSRTLFLSEDIETSDALKATITNLPENIVEEVEIIVADTSGENVDNKTRLELLKKREKLIQEEEEEKQKQKAEQEASVPPAAAPSEAPSEELQDKAPVISPSTAAPPVETAEATAPSVAAESVAAATAAEVDAESITAEELRGLSDAVSSLRPKKVLNEELEELKEDREEYRHDVEDLAKECEDELQESKASARLGRKVDSMIGKLDQALQELEDDLVSTSPESPTVQMIQKEKSDVITTAELEEALATLKDVSGDAKIQSLVRVLDEDHDGNINLEELGEVVESLALEDTDIKSEHIALIKELIKKEDLEEARQVVVKDTTSSS